MTPSHVSVSRCGGACHHSGHSCVATEQTLKQIPVILSRCCMLPLLTSRDRPLCRCGLSAGLCDKVCASVAVAEDTRCQCQCLEAEADQATCDPSLHHVNPQTCQCECKQVRRNVRTVNEQRSLQSLCSRSQSMSCVGSRAGCGTPDGVFALAPRVWSSPAHPVRWREYWKIRSLLRNCLSWSGFVFDSESTCSCVPLHELHNSVSEVSIYLIMSYRISSRELLRQIVMELHAALIRLITAW